MRKTIDSADEIRNKISKNDVTLVLTVGDLRHFANIMEENILNSRIIANFLYEDFTKAQLNNVSARLDDAANKLIGLLEFMSRRFSQPVTVEDVFSDWRLQIDKEIIPPEELIPDNPYFFQYELPF